MNLRRLVNCHCRALNRHRHTRQHRTKPRPSPNPQSIFPAGLASNCVSSSNMPNTQQQQQQQQQLDPLASYFISIPGLTIPKFQFLYHYFAQRPDLLTNEHWSVLRGAHGIALDRGVKEDSPEYFGFLHSLLNQQTTPRRRLMQRQHRRPLHQCRRRQNLCRSMWRMMKLKKSNIIRDE